MNAAELHAEATGEERAARERLRNLDKARRARRRQLADAAKAERQAKREQVRDLKRRERELSGDYSRALSVTRRLGQRVAWDDKEAAAWNKVATIGGALRGVVATRRRIEAELRE